MSERRDDSVASSLKSVLNRITSVPAADDDRPEFVPSEAWQGQKKGYYFGTNQGRTGYYRDHNNPSSRAVKKPKKRSVQIAEENNEMQFIPQRQEALSGAELLEQAERKQGDSVIVELTPKGLRSATNALVKMMNRNMLQRSQYADDPKQYMESELSLYDHITSLKAVAAANAELYQSIVHNEKLLSALLLQLLSHENADIASSVTSLLLEWVDPALLTTLQNKNGGNREAVLNVLCVLSKRVLTDSWETIVSNVQRFDGPSSEGNGDDDNDYQYGENSKLSRHSENNDDGDGDGDGDDLDGISNVLSLMENIIDIDMIAPAGIFGHGSGNDNNDKETLSAAAFMLKESKGLLSWLVQKLDVATKQPIDESVMRYMEIVTILSQQQDVHKIVPDWSELAPPSTVSVKQRSTKRAKIVEQDPINAIEILLQVIGRFRKNQPADEDEIDYLENACTTLNCCLLFSVDDRHRNMEAFLEGQGIELIIRCLKERTHAGGCGLKLLDFFAGNEVHRRACEHLVVAGGLKYIFPLFMGTRAPKQASVVDSKKSKAKRDWYHMLQTQTVRIMYALTRHLTESSPQDAQLRFVAKFVDDNDKCDRLVELLISYDQKARKAEYEFYRSDVEEDMTEQSILELAALEAKLKGGGEIFHRLGAIAAFLCVHSRRCHERILSQLRLQQSGVSIIKAALQEFISVISDDVQQRRLQLYLDQL